MENQNPILCTICGNEIPHGRLKALPNAKTCVNCSTTGKVHGRPVITGKTTYSEIEIISDESADELNRLDKSRNVQILK